MAIRIGIVMTGIAGMTIGMTDIADMRGSGMNARREGGGGVKRSGGGIIAMSIGVASL